MMNKKKRYFKDDWWMELNISDELKSHIMKNQLSYLHSPWTTKCDGWWKSGDRWQNLRNGWIINYIKLLDLFKKKSFNIIIFTYLLSVQPWRNPSDSCSGFQFACECIGVWLFSLVCFIYSFIPFLYESHISKPVINKVKTNQLFQIICYN